MGIDDSSTRAWDEYSAAETRQQLAALRAQLAEQQAQHQAELSRVAMATADLELAHESDVRELERRLAEAAELALRLSCEKGALGKSLAEAQQQIKEQERRVEGYRQAAEVVMDATADEDNRVADLTARLERVEGLSSDLKATLEMLWLAVTMTAGNYEVTTLDGQKGSLKRLFSAFTREVEDVIARAALAGQAEAKREE